MFQLSKDIDVAVLFNGLENTPQAMMPACGMTAGRYWIRNARHQHWPAGTKEAADFPKGEWHFEWSDDGKKTWNLGISEMKPE